VAMPSYNFNININGLCASREIDRRESRFRPSSDPYPSRG
jgi:hypothetical protein